MRLCAQVHSIREAATHNLRRLAEEFGPEWAQQHIIPQARERAPSPIPAPSAVGLGASSAQFRPVAKCLIPFGAHQVLALVKSQHYLYRMTVLYAIQALAPVVGAEVACSSLLPTAIAAARDRVPNIRFNVAKLLHTLVPLLEPAVIASQVPSPCPLCAHLALGLCDLPLCSPLADQPNMKSHEIAAVENSRRRELHVYRSTRLRSPDALLIITIIIIIMYLLSFFSFFS